MKITLTGKEKGEPVSISGINKLVIDLRNHIGGNMYDGIEILQNVYGDTTMFKACNKWYSLKDGKMIFDEIGKKLAFTGTIVVLVSGKTASSGEILALTFMNRDNVTVIGNKTAGFLTMNGFFTIDKKHILNLTISRFTDITGKEYLDECIVPLLDI
jgi:C-terminal processing protease CtpA/Prc